MAKIITGEDARLWIDRVKKAEDKLRRKFWNTWREYDDILEGESETFKERIKALLGSVEESETIVVPNLAYPIIVNFVSLLCQHTPVILVKSDDIRYDNNVLLNRMAWEYYLKMVWRKRRVLREVQRAVRDALVYGIGWLKIGFGEASFYPIRLTKTGRIKFTTTSYPGLNLPWVERVPPQNIIYDPDEGLKITDKTWIAMKVIKSLREVEKDKQFKSLRVTASFKAEEKEGEDYLVIYEIYDLMNNRVYLLSEQQDNYIIYAGDNPYGDHKQHPVPFVPIVVNPISNRFEGKSLLSVIKEQLAELAALYSVALFSAKSSIPKVFLAKPLDEEQRNALRSSLPFKFVEGVAPDQVQIFNPQAIPANILDMVMRLEQQIAIQAGFTRPMMGIPMGARTTATEVTEVATFTRTRLAPGIAAIDDACVEISELIRYVAKINAPDYELQLFTPFHSETGIETITIGDLDLESTYVQVIPGSTAMEIKQLKKQEALVLLEVITKFPEISPKGILELLLRRFDFETHEVAALLLTREQAQALEQMVQEKMMEAMGREEGQPTGLEINVPSEVPEIKLPGEEEE